MAHDQLFKELLRAFFRELWIDTLDLNADDYLRRDNPLAAALTALMKASGEGRSRQKQVSLQKVAVSDVDEAHKFLLTNLIETYLTMNTVC